MRYPKLLYAIVTWIMLATSVAGQQNQKKLTNQDVIDMVSIGLSDDLVIQKINSSEQTDFDTSVTALKVLKAAKVSDGVIGAMIHPHAANPTRSGSDPSQGPAGLPQELGVYYSSVDGYKLVRSVSAAKTQYDNDVSWVTGRGASFQIFTYRDAHAEIRTSESRPTFYARISESPLGIGDFEIFEFKQKKDGRVVEWSATNPEKKKGVLRATTIRVNTIRIAEGIYKLTPDSELAAGEYLLCTGFPGNGYDFSVVVRK